MNLNSKTGILPSQEINTAIESHIISAGQPIAHDQVQPASIDLRLDKTAYRVRASFLPGSQATVEDKLKNITMHKIDLSNGAVLERGCVYIVPIQERLDLPADISGMANPKSSTGRLDLLG
jgi:dCTP deaminase